MSSTRIIASVCTAQVFGQIGAYAVPALLPILIESWTLSYTEAGWLTGIFYGAYVLAVPILVSLTDRIDPRQVFIVSVITTMLSHIGLALLADGFWTAMLFRILAGIGWAGTYMPGLKALTDQLADGGRLATVVVGEDGVGRASLFRRDGEVVSSRSLFDASVRPLAGFARPPSFVF